MLSDSHVLGDEICPVREEFLGELYSASKLDMPIAVMTLAPHTRALLALFCFRRCHLRSMGLAIAAACEEEDLVRSGGRVGADLFARSRETLQKANNDKVNRRNITLATGPLRNMSPIDEEPEEELSDSVSLIHRAQMPDVLDQGSFSSLEFIASEGLDAGAFAAKAATECEPNETHDQGRHGDFICDACARGWRADRAVGTWAEQRLVFTRACEAGWHLTRVRRG